MKSEKNKKSTPQSKLLWLLVWVLIVAGLFADYHYAYVTWSIRAAIGIVLLVVVLLIASRTVGGHKAWTFIKSARGEMRKVVWPTRQETTQTTLMVVSIVVITALVLWGVDALFINLVGLLTGQGGF